jgi:hypothetical protein
MSEAELSAFSAAGARWDAAASNFTFDRIVRCQAEAVLTPSATVKIQPMVKALA